MSTTVCFLDTSVLVRHLTGTPTEAATRASRYLRQAHALLVPDLVFAEVAYVLESVYRTPRPNVAQALRSVLSLPTVRSPDREVLYRSIEVYELHGMDFADAYLVAAAEASGVGTIVSFDRDFDRLSTIERIEP